MAKKQNGGRREGAGRPKGLQLTQVTRDRIRTGVLLDVLHKIATGKIKKPNPVRVTAATVLLKKVMPDLTATDLTSGGQPLVMERRVFKRPPVDSVANGKPEKENDQG